MEPPSSAPISPAGAPARAAAGVPAGALPAALTRELAPAAPSRRIDPRWFSSSLLTLILVIGQWKFQILGDSYVPWIVALSTAVVSELALFRLHTRKWPNLLSAYISGNSVAILLKPEGSLIWPFFVGALLSIVSKYVLKYRDRHLWNPTNFSVCMMLLLAADRVGMLGHQWGNDPAMVAIIWSVGLLTVWRARVWHITLTYLAAFVVLAFARTFFNHQPLLAELGPVTGPMYQLFMFFMVTDPRTIVSGRVKQIGVVLAVALSECAIRLLCDFDVISDTNPLSFAPPMFALFLVGPVFFALQLARTPVAAGKIATG